MSEIHTEVPSSVYYQKPVTPLKIRRTKLAGQQETEQPRLVPPAPNSEAKKVEIINKIKQIAQSLQNGLKSQFEDIIKVCNSFDGTDEWTEEEKYLLRRAESIVRMTSEGYQLYKDEIARKISYFGMDTYGEKYYQNKDDEEQI